jgi:hypothetical protein
MPACRQCGKDNPEGTIFCGYCATPLARPAGDFIAPPTPSGDPVSAPPIHGSSPQPKPSKPEIRRPVIATPPPPTDGGKRKGGFELIPWNELSSTQKIGRSIAVIIAMFLIFFFIRGILRGIGAPSGTSAKAPSAQGSGSPLTEDDRRDGIESLCKVFQIYGIPKSDHDAAEAARNAAELFKLSGNQSPDRSAYILAAIVQEFRSGKLSEPDCAQAGLPIATTEQNTDNSTPDINRDNGQ